MFIFIVFQTLIQIVHENVMCGFCLRLQSFDLEIDICTRDVFIQQLLNRQLVNLLQRPIMCVGLCVCICERECLHTVFCLPKNSDLDPQWLLISLVAV